MMITKFLSKASDTQACGKSLASYAQKGTVIYLEGNLGAGKTTFVRGFLQGLGYAGKVKSPTYTLIEPYEMNGFEVYHLDLYRLQDAQELHFLGLSDYLNEKSIVLIEWPNKGFPLLKEADWICQMEILPNGRQLNLTIKKPLAGHLPDFSI